MNFIIKYHNLLSLVQFYHTKSYVISCENFLSFRDQNVIYFIYCRRLEKRCNQIHLTMYDGRHFYLISITFRKFNQLFQVRRPTLNFKRNINIIWGLIKHFFRLFWKRQSTSCLYFLWKSKFVKELNSLSVSFIFLIDIIM